MLRRRRSDGTITRFDSAKRMAAAFRARRSNGGNWQTGRWWKVANPKHMRGRYERAKSGSRAVWVMYDNKTSVLVEATNPAGKIKPLEDWVFS